MIFSFVMIAILRPDMLVICNINTGITLLLIKTIINQSKSN